MIQLIYSSAAVAPFTPEALNALLTIAATTPTIQITMFYTTFSTQIRASEPYKTPIKPGKYRRYTQISP